MGREGGRDRLESGRGEKEEGVKRVVYIYIILNWFKDTFFYLNQEQKRGEQERDRGVGQLKSPNMMAMRNSLQVDSRV